MSTLDLTKSRLLGKGSSRLCYVHPEDSSKCIKVIYTDNPGLNAEEMKYYRRHLRHGISWEMLARPYGMVDTTLGPGAVFSLAYDFDGKISKTLAHYLSSVDFTPAAPQLTALLGKLKSYLLRECIVVRELKADNLVYQLSAPNRGRLVLIDGIGNNQLLPIANYIDRLARKVISRKWEKFERHLLEDYPDNPVLREILNAND